MAKKYPVVVPGNGKNDNMTIAGYVGMIPEGYECNDFEDTPTTPTQPVNSN